MRWALDAAVVLVVGLGTLGAVFLLRDDGPGLLVICWLPAERPC